MSFIKLIDLLRSQLELLDIPEDVAAIVILVSRNNGETVCASVMNDEDTLKVLAVVKARLVK
jgi:hypothetical protein